MATSKRCASIIFHNKLWPFLPTIIFLHFLQLLAPTGTEARENVQWYSESSTQDRSDNFVHLTKLQYQWARFRPGGRSSRSSLGPFMEAGFSHDQRAWQNKAPGDHFAFASLGLKWTLLPQLFTFGEWRLLHDTLGGPPSSEGRAGIVYSDNYQWSQFLQPGDAFYNENYLDLIWRGRNPRNVFFFAKTQWGHRQHVHARFSLDKLVQLSVHRDRLGYYYENLHELALGLRPRLDMGDWGVNLQMQRTFGRYHGRQYIDPNPYGKNYQDWRLLLVLAGEITL